MSLATVQEPGFLHQKSGRCSAVQVYASSHLLSLPPVAASLVIDHVRMCSPACMQAACTDARKAMAPAVAAD